VEDARPVAAVVLARASQAAGRPARPVAGTPTESALPPDDSPRCKYSAGLFEQRSKACHTGPPPAAKARRRATAAAAAAGTASGGVGHRRSQLLREAGGEAGGRGGGDRGEEEVVVERLPSARSGVGLALDNEGDQAAEVCVEGLRHGWRSI